jgi:serine/threonine-protein kinase
MTVKVLPCPIPPAASNPRWGDCQTSAAGGRPDTAASGRLSTWTTYELLGEVGRGGMGVVYKAVQVGLNRVVALKMIRNGSSALPQVVARFRTEAEALARLQHPNIVPVYACGEYEGLPCFAMEFLAGGSLRQRLDGPLLQPRHAAGLMETLAGAVSFAHEQGILHRDLKPSNIVFTADGIPKLTDFGLARFLDDGEGPEEGGTVLGTPAYMAPEQARGDWPAVGPATDVYALGVILYELLAGWTPFTAPTRAAILSQVCCREPVPPSRLQPGVPKELETICLRCLRKQASQRHASALALAEDLRCFLSRPAASEADDSRRPGEGIPAVP